MNLLQDLNYALRTLRKGPGFAAAAILALALGIGANTAIFSVVNAALLRPLPFGHPDKLVQVSQRPPERQFPGIKAFPVSPANYLDWQSQNHVFEKMAIGKRAHYNLTGSGAPQWIDATAVSGEFFSLLQTNPKLGRTFAPEEDQQGHNYVAVLSHTLWQQHFGSNPSIVGSNIQLDGQAYTVAGVMGPEFRYPPTAELWTPLAMTDQERAIRGEHHFFALARLRSGNSLQQAQAELSTISRQLEQQYPKDNAGWGATVISLRDDLVGDARAALLVLLGAVAFVLLIACANVANLGMARTLTKRKEVAIRKALGAGRGRVIQQVVCESVLLSLAGGALGLVIAHFGTTLIVKFLAADLPPTGPIGLDWTVLAFTLFISLATGVLAGLAPAWHLTSTNVNEALKHGNRTGSDTDDRRTRAALVVSEVALSLMLLIGAGLMIRSLWHLRAVDPGFETSHAVTMRLAISASKFSTPAQQSEFCQRILEQTRTLPGIEATGAIDSLPLKGGSHQPIVIEGQPSMSLSEQPVVAVRVITPGYRDAMRIPLVQGRDFAESDAADRPSVALISAAVAKRFWPSQNPIGQHVTLSFFPDKVREIVGVVGDVKQESLNSKDVSPTLYIPVNQVSAPAMAKWKSFPLSLVVRTNGPATVIPAVVHAVHGIDGELAVTNVATMGDYVEETLAQQRFRTQLLATFAGLALVLTAVGIYSVLSYGVKRRVREIGIRRALGAPTWHLLRMIVMDGLKPTLAGIGIGVASALLLGRVLTSVIYGVSTADLTTFMAGVFVLIIVCLAASLVPAYRATRVEPIESLRED
ncbi:MAG TPA: ABC transporter permease [Candidatus Polarisedimenticolia bacterium]|jgi:putative ABC transport system permease protein|nr:ABC transporter permease [Candidatus Polarisedimenticolia bacterium]